MMEYRVANQNVSRETYEKLTDFTDLVRKWTSKINLISPNTVEDIWKRHVVDSAQIHALAGMDYKHWVDIGSGGGFPGIVIAIIAQEFAPESAITLIESDQRKATFLRTAVRELSINAKIICDRIENTPPQSADIVSARALTALSALVPLLQRHMAPDARTVLHKGRRYEQEIADARKSWSFTLEEHESLTDPESRILVMEGISCAG
ncbi:16S rRNA (guanine(527)-N(7))-methyltransferase RsmG [Loktanella agnita]|uniref:16S rRNA (guanine(527)-N(7))-methyltransferase RsmG n=1 Tax=Loktanella agnita TaxID=287097 RepID=UPI003985A581